MKVNKTEVIRARVEPDLKQDVESILGRLGLTTSEAITIFCKMVVLHNGLPFEVKVPNSETIKTMEDTDNELNLNRVTDKEELFKKLDLD